MPRWPLALSAALLALSATPAVAAPACTGEDPVAHLAETGLQAYRDALSTSDGNARTRALELAVRCYQLAQKKSSQGGAKLYHPLGLAYERLDRPAQAATALSAFLREVPESERLPGVTSQVRSKLAALLRRLGQLDIAAAAGTQLRVDEEPVGTAPLGHLVPVAAGVHVVTSGGPGLVPRSSTATVAVGAVERVTLDANLPLAAPETPRHVILQRWAIGSLGAGLVLAGAGAALWALADRPTCGDPAAVVTCATVYPPPGYGIALTALGAAGVGASIALFVSSRRARLSAPAQGTLRAQRSPTDAEAKMSGTDSRLLARSVGGSP